MPLVFRLFRLVVFENLIRPSKLESPKATDIKAQGEMARSECNPGSRGFGGCVAVGDEQDVAPLQGAGTLCGLTQGFAEASQPWALIFVAVSDYWLIYLQMQ